MFEIKNVTKLYKKNQGIQNVSFTLKKGQVCAIVGHNGSGKSTLFKSCLNLINVDEGTIKYNNEPTFPLLFGYLPENRSVIADLKTIELIDLLAKLKNMDKESIQKQCDYWMEQLQCVSLKNKRLKECSKGNQQKIQLICAIIHSPKIIILDEPFSGLDIDNTRLFQKIIVKLKKMGKIIILSSHRFEEIEHLCDMVCVLKESKVTMQGTLADIKQLINKQTITISDDSNMFYKDEKGIIDVVLDGNLTHYVFQNEKACTKVAKIMVEERNLKSMKISSLTLDDLYGGL